MVSVKHYLFLFLLPLLVACGKNEFTLEFDLESDVTENYDVTYYATDIQGGKTVQSVASVREGKCILSGATKKPTLAYLTARRSVYPLVIYAEKGSKIKITGSGKEPLDWNVEGNPIDEGMSSWRRDNIKFLTEEKTDSINSSIGDFVRENPSDPVSTLLMLCYFNRKVDENGYVELMGELKDEARSSNWLSLVGRTDQMFNYYFYPARFESMVMRSNQEGADTLKLNYKNPVLLLFWQTGYTDRKIMVDSIKKLEKEFVDSTMLLADLCLDIDSVTWKNAIRRDSLKNIKRFWVPNAQADPTIMKLKIPSLPYFIIFDSIGHQIYRGKELSEAIDEYRKIMPKKKNK